MVSRVTRNALRELHPDKENNPKDANGDKQPQQQVALNPATSTMRSKRDLSPIDEDNEEASQQEMQDELPRKRLQQSTMQPDWEVVGSDKVLTVDTFRTSVLHTLPALQYLVANRLFAALRSHPNLPATACLSVCIAAISVHSRCAIALLLSYRHCCL